MWRCRFLTSSPKNYEVRRIEDIDERAREVGAAGFRCRNLRRISTTAKDYARIRPKILVILRHFSHTSCECSNFLEVGRGVRLFYLKLQQP